MLDFSLAISVVGLLVFRPRAGWRFHQRTDAMELPTFDLFTQESVLSRN